jgi:hypothetical protein
MYAQELFFEMSLGVYSTTWNDYLYEEMFLVYILQLEGITYVKKNSWAYFLQPEVTSYVKKCACVYIRQPEVTTYVKKCSWVYILQPEGCGMYTKKMSSHK